MPLFQTLQTHQLPIPSPLPHQLVVPPTFHNHPPLNHINDIRLLDGTQPMRHRDGGPPLGRGVERRLDDFLALAVQRRSRFVEK